jgi:hypothetical protein
VVDFEREGEGEGTDYRCRLSGVFVTQNYTWTGEWMKDGAWSLPHQQIHRAMMTAYS